MKTALLPTTRIDPALRRELEAALKEGETLSAFITASVRSELQHREAQRVFIARGLAAEEAAETRDDWLDADDVVRQVKALASKLGSAPRRRAK
jgi:hypothetical protein